MNLANLASYFYNAYPQAAYAYWSELQQNQSPAFRNWLQNQYGRSYARYTGILPFQPNLTWSQFLSQQSPEREYGSLGWVERGESPARYAPRVRFVGF